MTENERGVERHFEYATINYATDGAYWDHLLAVQTRPVGVSRTLKRDVTTLITAELNRNLVSTEEEYAAYAEYGTACTTASDCGTGWSPSCTSNKCDLACTTDANCTRTGGKCLNNTCLELVSKRSYEYDGERRRNKVSIFRNSTSSASETESWTNDGLGRMSALKERAKGTTNVEHDYDALGRLWMVHRYIGGTKKLQTEYLYDLNDHPITIKQYDADGSTVRSTTNYKYDDFGRLTRVDSPDAGVTAYRYDLAGRMVERKTALGDVIAHTYDGLGRLTGVDYPSDTDSTFAYGETSTPSVTDCRTASSFTWPTRNTTGRLSSSTDAGTSHLFVYDTQGRLTHDLEKRPWEACHRIWTWTYDSAGRVSERRYPSGRQVAYEYTATDPTLVSAIKAYVNGGWVTIASGLTRRGPGGALSGYTSGGLRTTLTYDLAGTLMSRIVKDGSTVVFKREVTDLDANGQPLAIDGPTSDTSETFAYEADRYFLTSADPVSYGSTSPYKEQDWTYTAGALGLRDTYKNVFPPYLHWHLATNSYATGTSRLTETLSAEYDSYGTPNPEYDFKRVYSSAANGAIETLTAYRRPTGQTTGWESQGTFNLTLDDEGRHSALMGAYTYDHRWLRTRRVFSSNPLDFWHGGDGALVMELDCPASGSCVYCNESTADGGTPTCAESRPSQEYVWLDGAVIVSVDRRSSQAS